MHDGRLPGTERAVRLVAFILLAYGAALVFLQTEASLKLVRGVMGYTGWAWGGMSDLPGAWAGPTDFDDPARGLYSLLSLRQPLLPWIAFVAGTLLLLARGTLRPRMESAPAANTGEELRSASRPFGWTVVLSLGGLALAIAAAALLRGGNLLPAPGGAWTGSNFDEMVYLSDAALFLRGGVPYRDAFMAHPPGVVWAFVPALLFEKAWGGAAAFVAARQWLLAYSLLALPLVWLAARKLGGAGSAVVASLVAALDGKAAFAPQSDRQLPNVGVLETLVNVTGLAGLALYLYAPPTDRWAARRWWILGAGALCGISAMCKLPGIALLAALALYALSRREWREAGWLAGGGAIGAALTALPFFALAPGQMVRQAVFFQLLRPQEVREGIDQAARIATYPEAQITMLLGGLGIIVVAFILARSPGGGEEWQRWAIPALWAAPVIAVFTLSRSYHSQYYTQWVPPVALLSGAVAARQVWQGGRPWKIAMAAVALILAFPLAVTQWRVATNTAYDQVYLPVGRMMAAGIRPGEQAMAFDPGYTFAAGLPPARVPVAGKPGDYIIDTAGYTIYMAQEIDRAPWGELARQAVSRRERNEEDVLRTPEAQAALLAGAVGANEVVLDQKIGLPKLTAQSTRFLESLSVSREEASFATLLHMRPGSEAGMPPFRLSLAGSLLAHPGDLTTAPPGGNLALRAQDAVQVALYWRVQDYLAANLRVVVRLVDEGGGNARQVDTEPSEGARQTGGWRPGLVYPDIRNIPLGGLRAGVYRVAVRVYDPASGASSTEVLLKDRIEVR